MLKVLLSLALIGFARAEWDANWINPEDIQVTEEVVKFNPSENAAFRLVDMIPEFLIPDKVDIIEGIVDIASGFIKVITSRRGTLNVMNRNGRVMVCPWRQYGGFYRWRWTWTTRVNCSGIPQIRERSRGRNSGVAKAGCATQRYLVGRPEGQITFTYRDRQGTC